MPKLSARLRQRRKRREQLESVYNGMTGISNSIEMLLPILHDIGDSIIAMIMAPFVTADLLYLSGRILKLGTYIALIGQWSEEEIGWIGATAMANNVSAFEVCHLYKIKALSTVSRATIHDACLIETRGLHGTSPLRSRGATILLQR